MAGERHLPPSAAGVSEKENTDTDHFPKRRFPYGNG